MFSVVVFDAGAAEPGGGGHWGQSPPPLFEYAVKVPFPGLKVPFFHGVEVPFLHGIEVPFLHRIELIEERSPFFGNCRSKF